MPTWSGIIQAGESSKIGERPAVYGSDLVAVQAPVKARYEQALRSGKNNEVGWGVIAARRYKGVYGQIGEGAFGELEVGGEGLLGCGVDFSR